MRRRAAQLVREPWAATIALMLIYVASSLALNPGGYLGTDTGAKVYTLEVMEQRRTASPEVGYWAERQDPDGDLHPLHQAVQNDAGGWVAVTTLPLLEVGRPLYALGGYRLVLLLPMMGAVAAALAARAVALRLGDRDGMSAFWLVGIASPAAVYSLDFWEHSIALACMVGAVSILVGVAQGRSRAAAVLAGALFGTAATMRTESLVYALVAVGATCFVQLRRDRSLRQGILTGGAAVVGFLLPWSANAALESRVGAVSRSRRAGGAATDVGSDTTQRLGEALRTLLGANAGELAGSVVVGLGLVALILLALRAERRGERLFAGVCLALAGVGYLAGAVGELGFVPGLIVAFPIALAAAVGAIRSAASRLVTFIALGALPLVYAFQYVGGAAPQWGGRYTLTSSILLGTVGVVAVFDRFPVVGRGLVALSIGVTALGVAWLGVRSHGVDSFFEELHARAEPVVISRQAFLLREGGAAGVGERWLSTSDERSFTAAVDLVRELGDERFTVLEWRGAAPPPGSLPDDVREVGRARLSFVNVLVGAVTYEFAAR